MGTRRSRGGTDPVLRLSTLKAPRILIRLAEKGLLVEALCAMPECLCPEELGGAGYFEPVGRPLGPWMPTADHYPIMRKDGGRLTLNNVRLAHRLCNRVDCSKQIGRSYAKDLATVSRAREEAIRSARRGRTHTSELARREGSGRP